MNNIETFEKFVISQKGILIRDNKCLIMEFAHLPGHWDLPGGRIDKGEYSDDALRREFLEETGIKDFEILATVHYESWYTPKDVPVCGTASLIKNDTDEIVLSHEHLQLAWISESEIDDYNFFWACLPTMLRKGFLLNKLLNK